MTHAHQPQAAAGHQPRPPRHCRTPVLRNRGRKHPARRRRLEAIICDLHVIIRYDPATTAGIEARHGIPPGSLLEILRHRPTAQLASVGAIDYPQWLQHARQQLPPQAIDEWLTHHGHLNQPVTDLLTSTTLQGVRLLVTANTTPRLPDDLAFHDLGGLAEQTFASYQIGYAKPDPRAYAHILRTTGLDPTRTLCIETDPSWLPAAGQLGLPGHPYRSAETLRDELTRAGAAA